MDADEEEEEDNDGDEDVEMGEEEVASMGCSAAHGGLSRHRRRRLPGPWRLRSG